MPGRAGWRAGVRRLIADRRGVGALEMALALPVLIILYLGCCQYADAVAAKRKVTMTARTLADVTSQYVRLTPDDLDGIMSAAQQTLAPYPATGGLFRISQVTTDAGNVGRVTWSKANVAAQAYAVGAVVALPSGLARPNSNVLLGEVVLPYHPISADLFGQITLSKQIIMLPRRSDSVALVN